MKCGEAQERNCPSPLWRAFIPSSLFRPGEHFMKSTRRKLRRLSQYVCLATIAIFVAAIISGCFGSGATGPGPTHTAGGGAGAGVTISPAAGGTVISSDGLASLTIPPNALGSAQTFTITPVTSGTPAAPTGWAVVPGTVYQISPSVTFVNGEKATLSIKYSAAELSNAGNAGSLAIYYVNGNTWTAAPNGSTVNAALNTVSAQIPHTSTWAVLEPSTGGSTTGGTTTGGATTGGATTGGTTGTTTATTGLTSTTTATTGLTSTTTATTGLTSTTTAT